MELIAPPDQGPVYDLYWAAHRLCIGHPLFHETRTALSAVGAVSPEDLPNVVKGKVSPHLVNVRCRWAARKLWKTAKDMPLQEILEK